MKNLVMAGLLAMSGAALAGDYKPFVAVDASSEKDSLTSDYIGANITMGVKTADKIEYSIKVGTSSKNGYNGTDTISNNLELKLKKSYDVGMIFLPYVAVRLGEKLNSDATHFTHYAFDAGAKVPMSNGLALDIGYRYRNAVQSSESYRSNRYHAMFVYDIDQNNTIGLRYANSFAHKETEDRKSWRVHYQRNY